MGLVIAFIMLAGAGGIFEASRSVALKRNVLKSGLK